MKSFRDVVPYKGDCSFVGSRGITANQSFFAIKLSMVLALTGYTQFSGAANGIDTSSEFGAKLAHDLLIKKLSLQKTGYSDVMRIYLPWNGFGGRRVNLNDGYLVPSHPNAKAIAQAHYSAWEYSHDSVKNLMTRNVHQVLNDDLNSPVKFVACYTSDGVNDGTQTTNKTGGTGQAIRIGTAYGVPIFNIGNDKDKLRLEKWVESEQDRILAKFGIDLDKEINDAILNYSPFSNEIKNGDIVNLANNNQVDLIVHGCNCFNVKGAGLAKSIFDEYPEAYAADNATIKGDRKKLGTYTHAEVERNGKKIIIVNAYTQYKYGRDDDLYADYEAIRKVFKKINNDFPGKNIAIPKIGAGLANGCWISIANTIANEMKGEVTFVNNFTPIEPIKKKEYRQSELDL